MLVYVEGGKPENPEQNTRIKAKQQRAQPTYDGTGQESNLGYIGGRRGSRDGAVDHPSFS